MRNIIIIICGYKKSILFELLNIINHLNEVEAGHAGRVLLQNEVIFLLKLKDSVRDDFVKKNVI